MKNKIINYIVYMIDNIMGILAIMFGSHILITNNFNGLINWLMFIGLCVSGLGMIKISERKKVYIELEEQHDKFKEAYKKLEEEKNNLKKIKENKL